MSARVLVADDDEDIRLLLATTLALEGFSVVEASDGAQALDRALQDPPDAALLDVLMPRMSGLEALDRLRADGRTQDMPIVLVTARTAVEDAIAGLHAGADDYIRKPFIPSEVIARIHAVLRRTERQYRRNPLTGLPGNDSIVSTLSARLAAKRPTALLYVDLDNFKSYNDYYGFLRGDDVLRAVARLLTDVRRDQHDDTFVGHIGGDDFVLMTHPDSDEQVAERICRWFDGLAPAFYDPKDREQGYIAITDRQGNLRQFPPMSLSIGIAVDQGGHFAHPGAFVSVATEMKHVAKVMEGPGSRYARDRRHRRRPGS